MKIKLKTQQKYIKKGQVGESESCPVALALRDIVSPDCRVEVDGDVSLIYSLKDFLEDLLPPNVRIDGDSLDDSCLGDIIVVIENNKINDFVDAFDSHQPVKPFSTNINIPDFMLKGKKKKKATKKKR